MDKEYELDEIRTQSMPYAVAMAIEGARLAGASEAEIKRALEANQPIAEHPRDTDLDDYENSSPY